MEDYALVTLRTPGSILFHNEVGYTMPTWPANQTDGEQKIAGSHLMLRATPGGVRIPWPQSEQPAKTVLGRGSGLRRGGSVRPWTHTRGVIHHRYRPTHVAVWHG